MKARLQTKQLWLALAAAALILAAAVGTAIAYFTTYATAKGGYTLELGNTTTFKEDFSDWTKHVTVQNTGAAPCFVRVKVFSGSQFPLAYSGSAKWNAGDDGYWYYSDAVPADGASDELQIKIQVPETQTQAFNVVVVQESTAVLYKADGTAYADWAMKLDTSTDSYDVKGAA